MVALYTSWRCRRHWTVHDTHVLRTIPTGAKVPECKIPGTQKSHEAAIGRRLTPCPLTWLYGDTRGRSTRTRQMVKSGVAWRYFDWTCCCLSLLNTVLFIKPVSNFVNLGLSSSLVLKPLFQPYLAVSDEEKWDHVTAKSASLTLLLRRNLSAQSRSVIIKWRWMLSCPMEWALIQSSINLLHPKVCIFLKKIKLNFFCELLYVYYCNLINCWNENAVCSESAFRYSIQFYRSHFVRNMRPPVASNEATAKYFNAETNETTITNLTPVQRVAHHKNSFTAATISTTQTIPYSWCSSLLHISAVQISYHQAGIRYTQWKQRTETFLCRVRNCNSIM